MDFKFYPLRFEFLAGQPLFFPPGKAANTLRGALGVVFRGIACTPECRQSGSARVCEIRRICPYARIFEPVALNAGPSGFADPPRPFVFRARHLDGRTIPPGQAFYFDFNVFSIDPATLVCFAQAFSALAREGLGPGRGQAELRSVRRLAGGRLPEQIILSWTDPIPPATLSLDPLAAAPARIRVEFLSPTELKHEHNVAKKPEFPILFARIRDRIATLRALYGNGPLAMDYRASGRRATFVGMTNCRLEWREAERRSTRTGQVHSLGGFVGTVDYEGDLAEFLPWLDAARYTGVGRQSVWGKGELTWSVL